MADSIVEAACGRLSPAKRIPLPAGDGDYGLDVLCEQIPVAHQRLRRGTNTREVILFGGISFVDGPARIAARIAVNARAWKYQRGAE